MRRLQLLRVACAGLAMVLFAGSPPAAHASPDTLRRSLGNILWAPFDMLLAPVNAGIAVRRNLPYAGDSTGERVGYVPTAFLGFTLLHVLTGGLRAVTGVAQLPAGLALFPFPNTDLPDALDPLGRGEPLLGLANPLGKTPVRYVLPITPLTIDLAVGLLAPAAVYDRDAVPSKGQDAGQIEGEIAP